MNKSLEKEIDYLRDAKNNLWMAGLATFGGSFSLIFLNIPLFVKLPLIIIGFGLSAAFIDNYLKKGDKIETIIKVLRKRGD